MLGALDQLCVVARAIDLRDKTRSLAQAPNFNLFALHKRNDFTNLIYLLFYCLRLSCPVKLPTFYSRERLCRTVKTQPLSMIALTGKPSKASTCASLLWCEASCARRATQTAKHPAGLRHCQSLSALNGMPLILIHRNPFKIFDGIVRLHSVLVIDDAFPNNRRKIRLRHQTMYSVRF